jgi:hypothetical protein
MLLREQTDQPSHAGIEIVFVRSLQLPLIPACTLTPASEPLPGEIKQAQPDQ